MLSLILAATLAHAQGPEIKFLSSSSPAGVPLETVLTGNPVPFASARNLKISIVFTQAEPVASLHLESCEKDWNDSLQVFAYPGLQRNFIEGGRNKFDAKLNAPVQSIAIVFGHDANICLRNLKLFDAAGKIMNFKVPEMLTAKISQPVLFDQHPDSVVSLEKSTTITFDQPQKFDRAYIWTGAAPLYAHALKMTGDKNWNETLPLRDSPSDQEVIFKKPFEGKQITMISPDAGAIGEIRFALGTKVQAIRAEISREKEFGDAGFSRTLDFDWITPESEGDKWQFIFRQDGTFFIRGHADLTNQAHDYVALGSYTITRLEKNKVRLKVNGVRFPTSLIWDGVICPFACGNESPMERATQITDSMMIERLDEGSMFIRNRTPRAQRTVTFGDLKVRRAVDD